jgi:ubiquinone/menaquinone biosynthesis C-methylase UbiE
MNAERRYLPAASLDVLLPVYDPIMRLLRFQRALAPLVAQAGLQPEHHVLDIGCGTGTLAVMIRRAHPTVGVTGVDPDPRALARAARKAERSGVAIRFDRGFADALVYPDGTFDRVFSSMMFHHVPSKEKPGVLAEARRVLKPGGRLELLDFAGGTHSLHARLHPGSFDERLIGLMRASGFAEARRLGTQRTIVGAIAYYQAVRA